MAELDRSGWRANIPPDWWLEAIGGASATLRCDRGHAHEYEIARLYVRAPTCVTCTHGSNYVKKYRLLLERVTGAPFTLVGQGRFENVALEIALVCAAGTGRAYAAIDGDRYVLHVYKTTDEAKQRRFLRDYLPLWKFDERVWTELGADPPADLPITPAAAKMLGVDATVAALELIEDLRPEN